MKKSITSFLGSASGTAGLAAFSILILICLACRCGSDSYRSNTGGANTWNTPGPSNRANSSVVNSGSDPYSDDDEYYPGDNTEYPANNTGEYPANNTGGYPSDNPGGGSASGGGYYTGNWIVSRPNYEFLSPIELTINDDQTYSWKDTTGSETITGSWEMQDGAAILRKGYKGGDWLVRVFAPSNKTTTKDQIWISGTKESGNSWIEYKGTRKD